MPNIFIIKKGVATESIMLSIIPTLKKSENLYNPVPKIMVFVLYPTGVKNEVDAANMITKIIE